MHIAQEANNCNQYFFRKIGILLKNLNHVDIGLKIFVGAAACAKLTAAAFGGGVQHWHKSKSHKIGEA